MTYNELINEIDKLKEGKEHLFPKFNESLEFVHFEIFFEMLDEPQYTLLKARKDDVWLLAMPREGKMLVFDAGEESIICDEYYELLLLWLSGAKATIQKK